MLFLAPYALTGLVLLAVPILVHLFKPRKMRQTPFSSLRWLKQTHQRLSRRIQWHQWLLFLLRAGVIACLVLALARPLLGLTGDRKPTDTFVVIDAGPGMALTQEGQPTPLERAQAVATSLVQSARPGDRTALLLVRGGPRLLTPPVADPSAALAELKATRVSGAAASLSGALPMVRSLLTADGRDIELVFLTDNRPPAWQQGEIQTFLTDLPVAARVQVVDVGPGPVPNGWIADARVLAASSGGERILRVLVAGSGDTPQERAVRLAGLTGIADEARSVTLGPGPAVRVDFKLPAENLAGQVAELRLEPADALPADDVFYVNLDGSAGVQVLLVEPETPGADGRGAGLHLRTGLEALTDGLRQLAVVGRTPATLAPDDIHRADVIVLAGVPELSDAALESVQNRVRGGAGLVIFLGNNLNSVFYNQKLYHPLQPAEGLMPLALKAGADAVHSGKPGRLTHLAWQHPLLAPLRDPIYSDLTQSRFSQYQALDGLPGKRDAVLASFDDDVPALIEHPLGAGRVLLFNTSAGVEWSDLPRRKSYVPLLDQLVGYLASGSAQRRCIVGDAITIPLADFRQGEELRLFAPGGSVLTPRLVRLGEQTFLHLDTVTEAGVYRSERGDKKELAFVANASRGFSRLATMDAKVLEDWWSPTPIEMKSDETFSAALAGGARWPAWPALLFLAALLLLLETMYAAHLCPRVNPTLASSVVHRRGILRPLNENPAASKADPS